MQKMSVAEAAEHFGVSKEAIHNRIRRGSLQSETEEGVKLVLIDEESDMPKKQTFPRSHMPKSSDEKYTRYLEAQNAKLQERIGTLELETRTLREQKELMLIEERQKIEQIYKEKDEQLKNIINAISTQIVQKTKELELVYAKQSESFDAQIETLEVTPAQTTLISLKKYLKKQNLSEKKREKIQKRTAASASEDSRFIKLGKKIYLDLARYNYDDLLARD
ncbi:MAG: DNA-binding protein [Sulfurimonadaceae bacterium]